MEISCFGVKTHFKYFIDVYIIIAPFTQAVGRDLVKYKTTGYKMIKNHLNSHDYN